MNKQQEIRNFVRQTLSEEVNNFLKKEPETATKQLDDTSKSKELGDPLSDVKMNQMADQLGSDEKNAPTVAVKAGAAKSGNGTETGQRTANFQDKTELAEIALPNTEEELRVYISKAINERYDEAVKKEEEELKEGAVEELLGEPVPKGETDKVEEAGRSHTTGRTTHIKPKNFPEKFKR